MGNEGSPFFGGLVIGMIIGAMCGIAMYRSVTFDSAIRAGVGEYDGKTAEFKWVVPDGTQEVEK